MAVVLNGHLPIPVGGGTLPPCPGAAWYDVRQLAGSCDPNPPAPPPGVAPQDTSSIKKFLDSVAVKISHQSDSVFNWALEPFGYFREQGGIIVRKNERIYLKNLRPGSEQKTKNIDYNLEPGEELLGYFHTHPVEEDYKQRSFFSDHDFLEFHKKAQSKPKYIAFLECGNKRFAVVVENLGKYLAFMNFDRLMRLRKLKIEKELTPVQPTIWTNGQQASINAAIVFFGSASDCGLGLYETTGIEKINFIKLNP